MTRGRCIRRTLPPALAMLAVTAAVAVAAVTDLTLNSRGIVSADGQAVTLSGTVTCSALTGGGAQNYVEVGAVVQQILRSGAPAAVGNRVNLPVECTGSPQPYTVVVTNDLYGSSFRATSAVASVHACDSISDCLQIARTIKLAKK